MTKRMNYEQFLAALKLCADARAIDVAALQDRIASCDGPIVHGTQAEAVRFHDHRVMPASRKVPATPPKSASRGRPDWQDK